MRGRTRENGLRSRQKIEIDIPQGQPVDAATPRRNIRDMDGERHSFVAIRSGRLSVFFALVLGHHGTLNYALLLLQPENLDRVSRSSVLSSGRW